MSHFSKKLYVLLFLIFAGIQSTFGQYNSNFKNNVSLNPVVFVEPKLIDLKYERVFNNIFSLVFNPTYYNKDGSSIALKSFNFWLQGRFYLSEGSNAPQGWFFAPEVSIGLLNAKEDTFNQTAQTINTGLVFGHQLLIKRRFVIDLYFGLTKYYILNNEEVKTKVKTTYNNDLLLPSWGASLGYAF